MTTEQAEVKLTITESAQGYLAELLSKQDDVIGVRVFITQPGTPKAETCIAYCRDDDAKDDDIVIDYSGFKAYFEGRSVPFLEDALIDYSKDRMGGQLTIKAPNARLPKVSADSPLEDRINYVLYNEVNPSLAAHGGEVSLVEITEDHIAILKFGGGCQGCAASQQTMKHGIERAIREAVPQVREVIDATDHAAGANPYYK